MYLDGAHVDLVLGADVQDVDVWSTLIRQTSNSINVQVDTLFLQDKNIAVVSKLHGIYISTSILYKTK